MSKIRLIVFAYHHNAPNIASLRYRGLIKYLDEDMFDVFVIASDNDSGEERQEEYIYPVKGVPIGKSSKKRAIVAAGALAITNKVPKFLRSTNENSWTFNAVEVASKLVAESKAKGQPCLVLGTYSPIDALIAANFIANKFSIPLIQDFRDGFAFEPLGRKGLFPHCARLAIENSVCSNAKIILSATPSINDYFSKKYGASRAVLLMNGYDPDDNEAVNADSISQAKELLSDVIARKRFLIGHVGRVSLSDASSRKSLEDLVSKVNKAPDHIKGSISFVFMGNLSDDDKDILDKLTVPCFFLAAKRRQIALSVMNMCNALLLITGSRVCVISGKIFEYMSFGKKIVHFSQVKNDAFNILNDYGRSLQYINNSSNCDFSWEELYEESVFDSRTIFKFSKKVQAEILQDVFLSLI
jgi:glycosyltransferase involved in cell wall biosynthesis